MKSIFLCICLLFLSDACFAQTLKGTVLDADTDEPIVNANIYLNGTTIGNVSDGSGKYEIVVRDRIHTQLVVRYVGYETVIIETPFDDLPEIIYLKEKKFGVGEVTVKGKATFSEKQKMKAFKEQFLGVTMASEGCRILNEKDIRLVYDVETNKLHAYSDVPIEINNGYLGYKILWELMDFTLVLNDKKSLSAHNIDSVSIVGTASFEDTGGNKYTYLNRREKVYYYSKNRFFSLLANKLLKENKENVFLFNNTPKISDLENADPCYPGEWFTVKTEDYNTKELTINPKKIDSEGIASMIVVVAEKKGDQATVNERASMMYKETLQRYASSAVSRVYIGTDRFNVDTYGNTDMVKELFVTGTFGFNRAADQLPLDYVPIR